MDPDSRHKKRKGDGGFFKDINSGNLLKNIWQVGTNSAILSILNLIFHLLMGWTLSPSDYGELETLLTINSMLLIGLSAVAFMVARFISLYKSRQQFDKMKFLANWAFILFFIVGMAGFFTNLIFSRLIADYLKIADHRIIEVFGLLVWISFLMPIIEGILKGMQEFKFVGRYKVLDATLRLLIGGLMLYLGLSIKSLITGIVISGAVTILFTGYILRKMYITKPYRMPLVEIYKFAIPVFLTCIAFAILSNVDLVLVKHFFDAHTSGQYAAASILAKLTIILSFGSAGVMFPKIVEYYYDGNMKDMIKTFRNTLKIALIGGLLVTLLLAFFPEKMMQLFFGGKYYVGDLLTVYAIGTFFLSMASVLMMYDLAVKKYKFIPLCVFAAFVLVYQINIVHSTLQNIVWTLFVINFILAAFMVYYNKREIFAKYDETDDMF